MAALQYVENPEFQRLIHPAVLTAGQDGSRLSESGRIVRATIGQSFSPHHCWTFSIFPHAIGSVT